MNREKKKLALILALVLLVASIAVGLHIFKPFIFIFQPSATITVVDLNNKPVPGVKVTIDETDETFHWLGDVYDGKNMRVDFDGIIDEYDVNYTSGVFGPTDIDRADFNNDGKVDINDVAWISRRAGDAILVRESYPPYPTNITDTNGQVTFTITYTHPNRAYDYYTITVEKSGYQTKTVIRNLRYAQTIVLEPLPTYTLTVSAGTGGTTSPKPGPYTYTEGTIVTVSAIPNSGYKFLYWKLDGVINYANPIKVVMNTNHELGAYFEVIPPPPPDYYTLTISATVGGTTNPPADGVPHEYPAGSVVTVTATASSGYKFDHWELDGTPYSTNTIISITMTKSYTLKAVFTQIPTPVINVLTLLQFAPSTEVNVIVYITDQANKPLSGKSVTMQIADNMGTILRQSTAITGSDGKATIIIITPGFSGTYNATFTVETTSISQPLKVMPKILITPTSNYRKTQTYIPGDFDFVFEATITDTDGNMLAGYSAEIKLTDTKTGTEISGPDYTKFSIQGSTVTFKAKLYDWYKSKDPNFKYNQMIVKIELSVAKPETHIGNKFSDDVTMTAPYLRAIVPVSVELEKTGITISIRDSQGNIPEITLDNVEVIIQTPSGKAYSTRTELVDRTLLTHGDIIISFTFDEKGTYKITIRYYNLPWEQPQETHNVQVTEAQPTISILSSPYFWGIIGFIILILLLRRRRSE